MNTTRVRKAVFPVAGLGTRFLPATKASPKEMLPVVDKPLIQYAVEEAYEAGIRDMIFVTGRSKRAIEDHFDTAYELESELDRCRQNRPAGTGAQHRPAGHELPVRAPAAQPGPGPRRAVCRAAGGQRSLCRAAGRRLDGGPAGRPRRHGANDGRLCKARPLAAGRAGSAARAHPALRHCPGESAGGPLLRIDEIVEKPAPEVAPLAHGRGRALRAHPAHF